MLDETPLCSALSESKREELIVTEELGRCDGTFTLRFSVNENHLNALPNALRQVPSVQSLNELNSKDGFTRYQAQLSQSPTEYETWVELGGSLESATATSNHWMAQIRFPHEEALQEYYVTCEGQNRNPNIHKIVQLHSDTLGESNTFAPLTQPQHALLKSALEQGYFEVPREVSLERLAQEFEISSQAASTRLRRALHSLLLASEILDSP